MLFRLVLDSFSKRCSHSSGKVRSAYDIREAD